jgi:hypothetical protein
MSFTRISASLRLAVLVVAGASFLLACGDDEKRGSSLADALPKTTESTAAPAPEPEMSRPEFRAAGDAVCARESAQIAEFIKMGYDARTQLQARAKLGQSVAEPWTRTIAAVRGMTRGMRKIRDGLADLTPPPELEETMAQYLALVDRTISFNERGLREAVDGPEGARAAGRLWEKTGALRGRLSIHKAQLGFTQC